MKDVRSRRAHLQEDAEDRDIIPRRNTSALSYKGKYDIAEESKDDYIAWLEARLESLQGQSGKK
jgi:hypothetical protein